MIGTWRLISGRRIFVLLWSCFTLAISAYAVLKPGTSAADLFFLPSAVAKFLDENFDFRTLLMTLGVVGVPMIVLSSPSHDSLRRLFLLVAVVILVGFEFSQLWIPTRRFGWADVLYTLAGGCVAEAAVLAARAVARSREHSP